MRISGGRVDAHAVTPGGRQWYRRLMGGRGARSGGRVTTPSALRVGGKAAGAASGAQLSTERSVRPYPDTRANGRIGRSANGECCFFSHTTFFSLSPRFASVWRVATTTTTNQTIDSVWLCARSRTLTPVPRARV